MPGGGSQLGHSGGGDDHASRCPGWDLMCLFVSYSSEYDTPLTSPTDISHVLDS